MAPAQARGEESNTTQEEASTGEGEGKDQG